MLRLVARFCVPLLLLVAGCKPDSIQLPFTEPQSGTGYDLHHIVALTVDTLLAVGGSQYYYGCQTISFDGGRTWHPDSLAHLELNGAAVVGHGSKGCIVVGYGSTVLTTAVFPSDRHAWQSITLKPSANATVTSVNNYDHLRAVAFGSPTSGVIAGGGVYHIGTLLHLDAAGNVDHYTTLDHELASVAYADTATVVAVGYGAVLRSTDGGRVFSPLSLGGDFYKTVAFTSPHTGYIVGYTGTVLRTDDGGETWRTLRNPDTFGSSTHFRGAAFVATNAGERGLIVGESGLCYRTDDGGSTWKAVKGLPTTNFNAVTIVGNGAVLVGNGGHIVRLESVW